MFLGNSIGLRDWRQITIAFSEAHRDWDAVRICDTEPDNQIQGHGNNIANTDYGNTLEDPIGVGFHVLGQHLETARWWFHLVGMLTFLTKFELVY